MKRVLIALGLWAGGLSMIGLAGTPKIQFDTTVFDFGKTSQVETVSGTFKFKNTGDDVLKLEQPKPSCGCTVASLKKNTVAPGELGEIPFTLNLGRYRAHLEKHITVISNDPQTPQVSLTVKGDYIPLYDVLPLSLSANVPREGLVTNLTITRTDGKPLPALNFRTSKPWITAKLEPGTKPEDATARVRVEFQSEGQPRRLSEFVQVYLTDQTNAPLTTVMVYGRVMGDLALTPEALYWSVTDPARMRTNQAEALVTRRLTIKSTKGETFTLQNPQSAIKGVQVDLVPREWKKPVQPGKPEEMEKGYELVARLKDIPEKTITGSLSIETSLASIPKLEVPMTVYVYHPPPQQAARPILQPATLPRAIQQTVPPNPQPRIVTNTLQRAVALPATAPPLPPPGK